MPPGRTASPPASGPRARPPRPGSSAARLRRMPALAGGPACLCAAFGLFTVWHGAWGGWSGAWSAGVRGLRTRRGAACAYVGEAGGQMHDRLVHQPASEHTPAPEPGGWPSQQREHSLSTQPLSSPVLGFQEHSLLLSKRLHLCEGVRSRGFGPASSSAGATSCLFLPATYCREQTHIQQIHCGCSIATSPPTGTFGKAGALQQACSTQASPINASAPAQDYAVSQRRPPVPTAHR